MNAIRSVLSEHSGFADCEDEIKTTFAHAQTDTSTQVKFLKWELEVIEEATTNLQLYYTGISAMKQMCHLAVQDRSDAQALRR